MVKVIHVIISLEVGGAERMLERLVRETSKYSNIDQSIITLKRGGNIGLELQQQGFKVVSMGMESWFSAQLFCSS